MPTLARVVLLLAVLVASALAPLAARADPADVYSDFVNDGKLSCNHPRSDLEAVLHDALLDQYGDPLVLARLKLAIRRQLATGCGHGGATSTSTSATAAAAGSGGGGGGSAVGWTAVAVVGVVAVVAVGGWYGRRVLASSQ